MKIISRNIAFIVLIALLSFNVKAADNNDISSYILNKDIATNTFSNSYLSSNIVTAIAQDDNGMIWFGTKQGLNSYDSYDFEEYNQLDGIINATITDIQPLGDTLFIGTEKGLCIYDVKNKIVTNFFSETDSIVLPDNHIYYISNPINDKITICTKRGTSVYNLKTKTFYIPRIVNYLPEYESRWIEYMQYDDSWWIATSNGLVKYKDENQSIKHFYSSAGVEHTLPDNNLRCMLKIDETRIFLGTSDGLCLFDIVNETSRRIDLNELTNNRVPKIDVSKIISFNDEEIIVATYTEGMYIYNHKDNTAKQISKFDRRSAISDNYIFDVFKDANSSLWVATYTGLNRFENNMSKFSTVNIFDNESLLSITYFAEIDEDNILVGTESGIKVFNLENRSIKDFKTFFGAKDDYFESLHIYSFYLDAKQNYLWVGTRNDGLFIYDIKRDDVINVSDEYNIKKLKDAVVREILRDEYNNLWVATNRGLCRINLKDKSHVFYNNDENDETTIPYDDVFDLMRTDTLLYVTTSNGLSAYNYRTDGFTTYLLSDSITKDDVVKNNEFFDIVEGSDGRYYIGSYSNGMLVFSPDTKKFKTSRREDSFGTMVYSIIPDNNGYLWASTSKGIMRCSLETRDVTMYDVSDGLQGNEFTPNAFLRHSKGLVFFGGFNGFNYFNPDEIEFESKIPEVVVTKLQTNTGRNYRYLRHGDTVHLAHDENAVEISFATLNMRRKNMVKYSCMMENYDDEWTFYNSSHRYADYNKLRPGVYLFKLKASNEVKVWMDDPFELTIIIQPAWYQRISFKLSVLFVLFVAIYISIKQRRKIILQKMEQKRKINELEMQMAQLKQKTLQLQMNPHVIFNTLNSIQQYIINQDVNSAVSYLASFSRLMRRILNNSNERYVPLSDELDAVNLYLELESMRLGNRFSYEIVIDQELDVANVEIAPMIIQPFVENAIIHGLVPKKDDCALKIEVTKLSDDKLLCVIEDNGVGREYSERMKEKTGSAHKSYGMSITRRRLEMLSKLSNDDFIVEIEDLYDDNNEAEGTRVNIIISYQD